METPDFKRVIRGYDPEAVDQAWAEADRQLSEATATNKELRLQINSLREQNLEWGNRLKYYEQIEKDLRDALLSAQRIANQVKEEATKQADQLTQSAHHESETLISEATKQADQLTQSARRESETLISEATKQADQLTQSARRESETLISEATRISESKEIETETMLREKRQEIVQINEQLQGLVAQKTKLQTQVDQGMHHFKIVLELLGPSSVSSGQDD